MTAKKVLLLSQVLLFAAALWILYSGAMPAASAAAGSCGIKPIKPYVPYGCRDLVAECVCDKRGQNCKWQWVCVPISK